MAIDGIQIRVLGTVGPICLCRNRVESMLCSDAYTDANPENPRVFTGHDTRVRCFDKAEIYVNCIKKKKNTVPEYALRNSLFFSVDGETYKCTRPAATRPAFHAATAGSTSSHGTTSAPVWLTKVVAKDTVPRVTSGERASCEIVLWTQRLYRFVFDVSNTERRHRVILFSS